MSESAAAVPDWRHWYQRWEAQQGHHLPDREERFGVVIDVVGAVAGDAPRVVDLGGGPGSLARRVLEALPGATAVAVDVDPVLLAIGRQALGDAGGRLRFVDADLRGPWEETLEGQVDAVVSTTALHWLQPEELAALYRRVAVILRPGGVLVNGDSLGFDEEPEIAAAVRRIRDQQRSASEAIVSRPGESWDEWWDAVLAEPGLAVEATERSRRHHDHPEHTRPAGYAFHRTALLEAGFREVSTAWQKLTDRVLVAIR